MRLFFKTLCDAGPERYLTRYRWARDFYRQHRDRAENSLILSHRAPIRANIKRIEKTAWTPHINTTTSGSKIPATSSSSTVAGAPPYLRCLRLMNAVSEQRCSILHRCSCGTVLEVLEKPFPKADFSVLPTPLRRGKKKAPNPFVQKGLRLGGEEEIRTLETR